MAITAALPRAGVHPWPMDTIPDPEVSERPTRRRFGAAYKVAILDEYEAAIVPGAKGAIIRKPRRRTGISRAAEHDDLMVTGLIRPLAPTVRSCSERDRMDVRTGGGRVTSPGPGTLWPGRVSWRDRAVGDQPTTRPTAVASGTSISRPLRTS